jgi:tol-pal system protein YbgF
MHRPYFVFAAALSLMAAVSLQPVAAQTQTQADPGSAADTEKRIQRLEEQIVDLSAQLGTVQTMSQGGGGAASAPPAPFGGADSGGADSGRLGDLETQVRALSAQMSEILRRLNTIERRSGIAPSQEPDSGGGARNYGSAQPSDGGSHLGSRPAEQGTGFSVGGNEAPVTGFDVTIEQDAAGNPIRQGAQGDSAAAPQAAAPSAGDSTAPVRTATRSSPQAQAAYDKAYSSLVQRNYREATQAFGDFVKAYPTDPLAGPAYFWLGEASFTSGEYRQAADSFLKSSTNYPNNEKAAESLLKLGISLKRLGENQAACSSFSELARRFPRATPVLQRAEREKSRAQC